MFLKICVLLFLQTYHYYIDTGAVADPLRFRTHYHCWQALDVSAMRAGAALLTGVHDFTQFSNNAPERHRRNPVKHLISFEVLEIDEGLKLEVGPCIGAWYSDWTPGVADLFASACWKSGCRPFLVDRRGLGLHRATCWDQKGLRKQNMHSFIRL